MKKKLFLTMAAILLLCVGVMTVYAAAQPPIAEETANGKAAETAAMDKAQRVDVLNAIDLKHHISIIIPCILNNLV
ncbi:MAG: hypothetical protein KH354_07330 [Clostridiales bacterium]|nr:hypothetical protein [Clostridiales bacterium]